MTFMYLNMLLQNGRSLYSVFYLVSSMAGMRGVANYGTSYFEECPLGSLSSNYISFRKSFI
jgi:hypothetical protein